MIGEMVDKCEDCVNANVIVVDLQKEGLNQEKKVFAENLLSLFLFLSICLVIDLSFVFWIYSSFKTDCCL